jgi:hypothetical protein
MEISAISNISFFILMIIKFIFFFKYTYNPETAGWRPRDMQLESLSTQFHSLQMINYENGAMEENVQAHENQLLVNKFYFFNH